jgi:hypothetical protein
MGWLWLTRHGRGPVPADHEPTSAAINLGRGAHIDKLDIRGSVAGRDVNIGITPADAAVAQDRQEVLKLLLRLQEEVAALQEAPSALRGDAGDELRKAHDAGEQGDSGRLVEKLESARGYLERIGQTLPAALGIAQTVAAIASRAAGLW